MAPVTEASLRQAAISHYCARCLETTSRHAAQCGGCDLDFHGSGSFQRLAGEPPARTVAR